MQASQQCAYHSLHPLDLLDPKMDSSPLCLSRFREQIPGSQCRRVEIPFSGLKLRCENSPPWRQGSGTQYISRIFWKSLLISISPLGDRCLFLYVCGKIEKGKKEIASPLRVAKLVQRQLFCNSCMGSLISFWNVVFTVWWLQSKLGLNQFQLKNLVHRLSLC